MKSVRLVGIIAAAMVWQGMSQFVAAQPDDFESYRTRVEPIIAMKRAGQ